jgi:SPP1 family phage portal protein
MNIQEILQLEDFNKVLLQLKTLPDTNYYNNQVPKILEFIEQYDLDHEIMDREDKIISGKITKTAKLPIPFQKKIVETALAFTIGAKIKLVGETDNDKGLVRLKEEWKSLKLDKHTKQLLRALMTETHVAELFYIIKASDKDKAIKLRTRVKLLCLRDGYEIYPHFDEFGDMDAFTVCYTIVDKEGKNRDRIDIYTSDLVINATKFDTWEILRNENKIGKIPVIYYQQDAPEWADVQFIIDRMEMMLSKNADANDYFGSPAIVAKGKVVNMPDKGEVGKIFQVEAENIDGKAMYGDLSYLTWDRTPESIKMEFEILKDIVYSMTNTPDLSFNNVKGTSNLSGIAFKFMFMDASLKASTKRELLSEGLERRINLLKAILGNIVDIKSKGILESTDIQFEYSEITPDNVQELVDMLVTATGNKSIVSQATAVRLLPFVVDPEAEISELKGEAELANALPVGDSFQVGNSAK